YGKTVQDSLTEAGFRVVCYTFSAGEASKNGQTYLSILNFLAENQLTRADALIALGGGVVGDITGFAAATYLRGIRYIQLPTTLLAMVDSSVGGKTAIDLPAGKNLAGAFCQPNLVLCDTNALRTLPREVFVDGCAEVIKYGVLFDPDLFSHLEEQGLCFDKDYVVSRCVELKRDVVRQDEFDLGLRQKLNLGHTIGHSLERLNNFALSHGQAVAIGMAIVSRAATATGICNADDTGRILKILPQFSLPVSTDYAAEKIYECALSDKKRAGATINLILPETIGNCVIKTMPIEQLLTFIEEGL
ncbi:MAG: 3-dehydroquinate synthase, partial [Oscillospiraceae bacterium]|nr:3-dehydroquinate synthase [Oscillospiraceae bacterium]